MATIESLTADIDRVIAYFNARKLDLPDGLFDRRTQFVINGAPFETLLGRSPDDPLILMLARGPAGFRFTAKALQHAIPDAKLERPSTRVVPATPDQPSPRTGPSTPVALSQTEPLSLRTGGGVAFEVTLTGRLRGTEERLKTIVQISLKLDPAGRVEVAEATVEPPVLDKIRQARLQP